SDRDDHDCYPSDGARPPASPPIYQPLPAPASERGQDLALPERSEAEEEESVAAEQAEAAPQPAEAAPPPPAPRATGESRPPRPIAGMTPSPRYPPAELRRGRGGTVMLRVEVGQDGVPTAVTVAESSRSRALDRAAIEAVRGWRFEPALLDGQPAGGTVRVPIEFPPARGVTPGRVPPRAPSRRPPRATQSPGTKSPRWPRRAPAPGRACTAPPPPGPSRSGGHPTTRP